jgi:hypothetical protein
MMKKHPCIQLSGCARPDTDSTIAFDRHGGANCDLHLHEAIGFQLEASQRINSPTRAPRLQLINHLRRD